MIGLGLAALLALASAPGAPDADADAEGSRAEVESYLGAIDRPVPASAWQSLGAEADGVLANVATSRGALPSRRARALEGLAARGGPRAEEILVRVSRDADEPFAVRASAIRGAGRLLAPSRAARALEPVLREDGERAIRGVVAETLAARAPRDACEAVRAQARREPARDVRFARALAACRR